MSTLEGHIERRTEPRRFKERLNSFVDKHDLAWTLVMAFLAIIFIMLSVWDDQADGRGDEAIQAILYAITGVFVVEFGLRFYAAPSRWKYLKYHWVDLLAVLPSARFLRILGLARLTVALRLLRMTRLGVVARSLSDAHRATQQLQWIGDRNGLPTLILVAVGMLWIGSGAVYELEHGVNPQFASFGDAFWWAFSTMATLGYGSGPQTVLGRIVAGILMFVGIACFGLVTATVTTFIIRRTEGRQEVSTADLMEELKAIRHRISDLETTLSDVAERPRAPRVDENVPVG